MYKRLLVLSIFLLQSSVSMLEAQSRNINIIIHLRGIYISKISLLSLSDSRTFKPIAEVDDIRNDETTKLSVSQENLPGEFVLRFDYRENESSTPYPSEKYLFINDQDLELWVNPIFCNNADSTWFQKDEKENSAFLQFSKENRLQKEKIAVLQNFLMNYDDIHSALYHDGIKEFEHRRLSYNQWLTAQIRKDSALFISTLYNFQFIPEISWIGSEADRIINLIKHYLDGMDFKNPLLIKTSEINKWMDGYVNLYGQLATTLALRDSLFPLAGKTAIEKAKQGHPLVYGWMVDYFYRGYETNGIDAGMKVLEPYLSDSGCLTSKRQEILRRLKGMESLIAGSQAPNIIMQDIDNNQFELNKFETFCNYILILFWSAGCSRCVETVNILYPWSQLTEVQKKIKVIAISLDESEAEINSFKLKIPELKGWKHFHISDGVRSKVARDYYVLATPVMFLLDAKTKKIVALPNSLNELMAAIN